MVITKDLGAVSAYAYAVEQGYQGTEEEFAELMARQATVAEEAAASADAAAASERNAQASAEQAEQSAQSIEGDVERAEQAATTATNKATEAATSATTANGAAQTATGKASEASASATAAANSASAAAQSATNAAASATAAQTAQTVAETAQGKAEDAQAAAEAAAASIDPDTLVKKTELEDYAKIDGSYETMTVGNAEQLVATVGVDDSTPYNFRTSGGSVDIGDRETVNAVVGGTVAWNQLAKELNSTNYIAESGVTLTFSDGVASFTSTITNNGIKYGAVAPVGGHVYLCLATAKASESTTIRALVGAMHPLPFMLPLTTAYNTVSAIGKASSSIEGTTWFIVAGAVAVGKQIDVKNFAIFDLTAMFGSTIADYIYGLEQANAGAGVAYFRKLFPKPYYAYNSGELLSVNTSQHKMVGFNQWDEEWELGTINHNTGANEGDNTRIRSKNYIPCFPATTYYIKAPASCGLRYYDAGKNFLGSTYNTTRQNQAFITPDNAYYIRFSVVGVTTYANDICINLSWDGERDGEYEPYKEWVYPLDSSLTLRGIPKLDANNDLYYDGDTYESDGTVTRKWNFIDLSTLAFTTRDTGSVNVVYSARLPNEYKGYSTNGNFGRNMVGDKLSYIRPSTALELTTNVDSFDVGVYSYENDDNNTNTIYVVAPVGTEKSQFGNLLYLLATPTTETATPYTQIQTVDDFGTEKYTDFAYENGDRDVAIPVGNNTVYSPNLRAKLEMSPNSPDGDGLYVVEQSNGQNEYVPLVIPTELPTAPSEDGTYTLKITVSGGTVTKSWIAEE